MSGPTTNADDLAFLADPRFAAALRRLQHKLERLATRLADVGEDVDDAARALDLLVSALPGALAVVPPSGPRPRPVTREARGVLRAEADAGVPSLEMVRHADGSLEVSVNGRRSFRLPPLLAMLLCILVAPGATADDGLMGWRSKAEVAAALGKQAERAVSPRDVTRVVHRLRTAFHDAGENWFLIQTHRRLGVRFALRV